MDQKETDPALLKEIQAAADQDADTLDLASRGLLNVPPEIARIKNLVELSLMDNPLDSLDMDLAELQKLERLLIDPNQLSRFPAEVAALADNISVCIGDPAHGQIAILTSHGQSIGKRADGPELMDFFKGEILDGD